MAEIDIPVEISVGSGGAKSLSDLKKEFKDLQKELSNTKEGTKEYQLALQKLGAVKDDIGDLRDTINALNPEGKVAAFAKVGSTIASGFAAAQGAAALFGAESEELQKTMLKVQAAMALAEGIKGIAGAADAFKVLNTVMRSNPIFLIAAAIAAIGTALFALKDKIGFIGDAFTAVGEAIDWVIDKVTEFTDYIGISNSELTKLSNELTEAIKLATEALKKQTQAYDDQIAVAKASGKSTVELEKAKQKAIIETNKALVEQTIAYVRAGGELDKEKAKLLTEQLNSIRQASVQIEVIEATSNKKKLDDYKKYLEDKAKADKEEFDKDVARRLAYNKAIEDGQAQEAERQKKAKEQADKEEYDRMAASSGEAMAQTEKVTEHQTITHKKSKEEQQAINEQYAAQGAETTKRGLEAGKALTDLYFAYQLKQSKGNAAAELELRKKQFKVNKAFGIANAVVDGIGAVQKALNNPYPLNIVLAVISGLAAAVNIAKIASAKFEGGESGGGAGDVGSLGTTASAPVIPQPNNTTTKISDDGKVESAVKPKDQKVFILEGEMTKTQERQVNIEESAKIG